MKLFCDVPFKMRYVVLMIVAASCGVKAQKTLVRLQPGTMSMTSVTGPVQVWCEGSWLSVCADGWDNKEADVVCRSLGEYSKAMALASIAVDYSRSFAVLVACSGAETNISQCNTSTTYYCRDRALAGVICISETPRVRLVGGHVSATSAAGRVEVFHDGHWGTVCDDHWDDHEARVICNMLGYTSEYAVALRDAHYGEGEGQILLDEIRCTGNETDIFQCRHDDWNDHDCDHDEDASVECGYAPLTVSLTNGQVSESMVSGKVEVTRLGVRAMVCDDDWDSRDADVICRMLQLPFERSVALSYSTFGSGDASYHLDNVRCVGNETSIAHCEHNGWGNHNCGRRENAGVICQFDNSANETTRLVGGSPTAGAVEIERNGNWENIGASLWSNDDARVVCRMLNLSSENATAEAGTHYGHGRHPVGLSQVECVGNESSVCDCPHLETAPRYSLFNVAGVDCDPGRQSSISVRLINGHYNKDSVSGRVEVLHRGRWGTICDNGWDKHDARVVCRMLGFSHAKAQGKPLAYFGQGTSDVLLSNVRCTGEENSLSECSHAGWGVHDCSHAQDANVICQEETVQVWLASGQLDGGSGNGQLEVLYNGRWGTVCDGDWDAKESGVVCKMAGLSLPLDEPAGVNTTSTRAVPVAFHGLYCDGDESTILACRHFTSQPASAGCSPGSNAAHVGCLSEHQSPGSVRLTNGTVTNSSWSGRLEVYQDGQWMSVCSDHWGHNETATVCKALGFMYDGGSAAETVGSGESKLFQVDCPEEKPDLKQCSGLVINSTECTSGRHVTITCLTENVATTTDHANLSINNGSEVVPAVPVVPVVPVNTEQSYLSYGIPRAYFHRESTDDALDSTGSSKSQTTPDFQTAASISSPRDLDTTRLSSEDPRDSQDTSTSREFENTSASREVEDTSVSREFEDTSVSREFEDTSASREFEVTSVSREFEDTSASREFEDTSASHEIEDTSVSREFEDTSVSREFEQTSASREFEDTSASRDSQGNSPSPDFDDTTSTSTDVGSRYNTTATQLNKTTKRTETKATKTSTSKKSGKYGYAEAQQSSQSDSVIVLAVIVPVIAIAVVGVVAVVVHRRLTHNIFDLGHMDNKDDSTDGGYFNPVYENMNTEEHLYSTLDFDKGDHYVHTQTSKLAIIGTEIK